MWKLTRSRKLKPSHLSLVLLAAFLDIVTCNTLCTSCRNNLFNSALLNDPILSRKPPNSTPESFTNQNQKDRPNANISRPLSLTRVRGPSSSETINQSQVLATTSTNNGSPLGPPSFLEAIQQTASSKRISSSNAQSTQEALTDQPIVGSNEEASGGAKLSDLSSEELNAMRTEYLKYRILDKLGLNGEPEVGLKAIERAKSFLDDSMVSLLREEQAKRKALANNQENSGNPLEEEEPITYRGNKLILSGHRLDSSATDSLKEALAFELGQKQLSQFGQGARQVEAQSIELSIRLTPTITALKEKDNSGNSSCQNFIVNATPPYKSSYIGLFLQQDEPIDKSGSQSATLSRRYVQLEPVEIRQWPCTSRTEIWLVADKMAAPAGKFAAYGSQSKSVLSDRHSTERTDDQPTRRDSKQEASKQGHQLVAQLDISSALNPTSNRKHLDNNVSRLSLQDLARLGEASATVSEILASPRPYRHTRLVVVPPTGYQLSAYLSLIDGSSEAMFPRYRRSLNCDSITGNKNACCRQSFFVNFTDIGWDKWILHPAGYDANYCKGRCDLSHARFYHSSILSKYSNLITLCCSPKRMSPLTLIYLDQEHQLHQKIMPDMIVDSCDCA